MRYGSFCRILSLWIVVVALCGFIRPLDKTSPPEHPRSIQFIHNEGQVAAPVEYYVRGSQAALYFTPQGVTYALKAKSHGWALKLQFVNANPNVQIRGLDPASMVHYLKGSKHDWRSGIQSYQRIHYSELWPGIDLVYDGSGGQLKYSFIVKPGADPRQIQLAYAGAAPLTRTDAGELLVSTPLTQIREQRPVSYQFTDGKHVPVASRYRTGPEGKSFSFALGTYDSGRALIIDPLVLDNAGFIGGSDIDRIESLVIDAAGNAYVTGHTESTAATFPVTAGAFDLTQNGSRDVFVGKVSADGSSLEYLTYLGGSSDDEARAIAIDSDGNAYVTGKTESTEASFPIVGVLDGTYNTAGDAFVAKLSSDGSTLVYSGYIGGNGSDLGLGIEVDADGNAYVAGSTESTAATFPETASAFDETHNGNRDIFAAKINPAGDTLVYATYIGGAEDEKPYDIAIDNAGNVFLTGRTTSDEATFPVTAGSIDETFNGGGGDAYVLKLNAAGSALDYAGFLGGSDQEHIFGQGGIVIDDAGRAYVSGSTSSDDFPGTDGAFSATHSGVGDAYAAVISPDGSTVEHATLLGGTMQDNSYDIGIDEHGNVYLVGWTFSSETDDFPVSGGPDLTHNGDSDGFVAKFDPTLAQLLFSGFIGGDDSDSVRGIAVGTDGEIFLGGATRSDETTYPDGDGSPVVGPFLTHAGADDGHVAKFSTSIDLALSLEESASASLTSAALPLALTTGEEITYDLTLANDDPIAVTGVTLSGTIPDTATITSVMASQGDCTEGTGTITCDLGILEGSASASASVKVTADEAGTLSTTFSLSANEPDPDADNNVVTSELSVMDPNGDDAGGCSLIR